MLALLLLLIAIGIVVYECKQEYKRFKQLLEEIKNIKEGE